MYYKVCIISDKCYLYRMNTIIKVPFLDFSQRRGTECKRCDIGINDHFLTYRVIASYEQLNTETGIWEHKDVDWETTRQIKDIAAVELYYDNREEKWSIGVEFQNRSELSWVIEDIKPAKVLYDSLFKIFTEQYK